MYCTDAVRVKGGTDLRHAVLLSSRDQHTIQSGRLTRRRRDCSGHRQRCGGSTVRQSPQTLCGGSTVRQSPQTLCGGAARSVRVQPTLPDCGAVKTSGWDSHNIHEQHITSIRRAVLQACHRLLIHVVYVKAEYRKCPKPANLFYNESMPFCLKRLSSSMPSIGIQLHLRPNVNLNSDIIRN